MCLEVRHPVEVRTEPPTLTLSRLRRCFSQVDEAGAVHAAVEQHAHIDVTDCGAVRVGEAAEHLDGLDPECPLRVFVDRDRPGNQPVEQFLRFAPGHRLADPCLRQGVAGDRRAPQLQRLFLLAGVGLVEPEPDAIAFVRRDTTEEPARREPVHDGPGLLVGKTQ